MAEKGNSEKEKIQKCQVLKYVIAQKPRKKRFKEDGSDYLGQSKKKINQAKTVKNRFGPYHTIVILEGVVPQ